MRGTVRGAGAELAEVRGEPSVGGGGRSAAGAKILARRQAPILYVVSGFSRTVIAVAATR